MRELHEILQAMLGQKDKIKDRHELLLDMGERVVKAVSQEFGCKQDEVAILLLSLDGRHLRFVAPRRFAELGSIPTSKRDSIAVGVLSRRTGEVINNVPMVKHVSFFESIKLRDKPIPIQKMVSTPLVVKGQPVGRGRDQPQGRDDPRRRGRLHAGRPAPRAGNVRRHRAVPGRGASARLLETRGGSMRSRRGAVALACFAWVVAGLSARAAARPGHGAASPTRSASPVAQAPATDIFLVDLACAAARSSLGRPQRVTEREGYDNQPAFSPDGRCALLHVRGRTARRTSSATTSASRQTRPWAEDARERVLAHARADGGGLSVVRVEADGTQRLWRLPEGGAPELLLPDVKPVGYHAWADAETLVLFVLGRPADAAGGGPAHRQGRGGGEGRRPLPAAGAGPHHRELRAQGREGRVVARGARAEDAPGDAASRACPRASRTTPGCPTGGVMVGQGARLLELPPGAQRVPRGRALRGAARSRTSPASRRARGATGSRWSSDEARPFPLTVDEHHARTRARRLSALRPALVGRLEGAVLRVAAAGRGRARDLRGRARRRRAAPALGRGAQAGSRPRPASGTRPRRRCLFVQEGDVVARRHGGAHAARARAARPRPSRARTSRRGETAVTFVRDNNLFRVALGGDGDVLVQLTDVGPKKKEPKLTDEPAVPEGRGAQAPEARGRGGGAQEAGRGAEGEGRRRRSSRSRKASPCPRALLSGDGRFAFLLVAQKAEGAKTRRRAELRHGVGLHRDDSRPHERRRQAGGPPAGGAGPADAQERLGLRRRRDASPSRSKKDEAEGRPTAGAPKEPADEEPAEAKKPPRATCAGAFPLVSPDGHARGRGGARRGQQGPLAGARRPGDRQGPRARPPARRRLGARVVRPRRASAGCRRPQRSGSSPRPRATRTSTPSTRGRRPRRRKALTSGAWEVSTCGSSPRPRRAST